MCHLSPTVLSLQQAIPNNCPAKALAPSQRLTLGLQAVAGTQTITGLADAFDVSRKFVYQQAATARAALEEAFSASTTAEDAVLFAATTLERQTLIEGLNHDLAGEYQAILMYTHYSAKLTGPYRRELRALFQAEIADEQGHAQFLADKIAALGGEPTTEPRPVPHASQPREMLERALAAEQQAIADYNGRIRQAEASVTSASRWTWKTRSPTRHVIRRNSSASLPAGTIAESSL